MDPADWERQADEAAIILTNQISNLEERFKPSSPTQSYRSFWAQVRDIGQRIQTAPAIKSEDKISLQHRLNELCQRARRQHRASQVQSAAERDELRDRLQLLAEGAGDAETIDEIQAIRTDLSNLRIRLDSPATMLPKEDRSSLWQCWQTTNRQAWEKLHNLWSANEAALTQVLDEAESRLTAGDIRNAKEGIRQFHARVRDRGVSQRVIQSLRNRAAGIWESANERGREKHESYLAYLGRRLDRWKASIRRMERERENIVGEIEALERESARVATDVAAAVMRARLAERRKELKQADASLREMATRISEAEASLLGQGRDQAG